MIGLSVGIPRAIQEQAKMWTQVYRPERTEDEFIRAVSALEQGMLHIIDRPQGRCGVLNNLMRIEAKPGNPKGYHATTEKRSTTTLPQLPAFLCLRDCRVNGISHTFLIFVL